MKRNTIISLLAGGCCMLATTGFSQLLYTNGAVGSVAAPHFGVGVGTNTPIMKLDVYRGDMAFTSDNSIDEAFVFLNQYWMTNGSLVLTTWKPSVAPGSQPPGKQWIFEKDGDFHVNGGDIKCQNKIWAREVEVKLPPFPDYVFEESYSRPSIAELESYIKDNKHLPGIPSATEIEKNGIGIGDLQARLLAKIEELTLYMIEINETNVRLQREVNQLKTR